jgi:hypothetical protein
MSDVLAAQRQHAFNHAPAALRLFRFAADSAPRVLELAHVSAFLRECAVDFGSADAALPGAMQNEFASRRYFVLRAVVERNAARCLWLAEKLLACRSGAPMPAAALAPDVTRHDVNWGAEGARRDRKLQLTHGGFGLTHMTSGGRRWAQGPVGVSSGKHFFQVSITEPGQGRVISVGFVDDKISVSQDDGVGRPSTHAAGAVFFTFGAFAFGSAPLARESNMAAQRIDHPCAVGCLLDLEATPARMTVFVDGEPLAQQCPYDFPKDGRAWYPSVSPGLCGTALHSCAI